MENNPQPPVFPWYLTHTEDVLAAHGGNGEDIASTLCAAALQD